jgi:hypothetical protein
MIHGRTTRRDRAELRYRRVAIQHQEASATPHDPQVSRQVGLQLTDSNSPHLVKLVKIEI